MEVGKFDYLHSSSVKKPTHSDSRKSEQNVEDDDNDNNNNNNNEDEEAGHSYGYLEFKEIHYSIILDTIEKRRREFEAKGGQLGSVEKQISEATKFTRK